jgi:hypothetical protein
MSESLLPAGVAVDFSDIESALAGSSQDARRAGGTALTATVVVAGPLHRMPEPRPSERSRTWACARS